MFKQVEGRKHGLEDDGCGRRWPGGGGACPLSPLDLGGGGDVKLLEERVVGSFFARQTGEEYNKL